MKKILITIILIIASLPLIYLGIQKLSQKELDRTYTPNKKFYVVCTSITTYRNFIPISPGNGSDNQVGYIYLYYKDGTLIDKYFHDFMGHTRPRIYDDSIFFIGDSDLLWDLEEIEKELKI